MKWLSIFYLFIFPSFLFRLSVLVCGAPAERMWFLSVFCSVLSLWGLLYCMMLCITYLIGVWGSQGLRTHNSDGHLGCRQVFRRGRWAICKNDVSLSVVVLFNGSARSAPRRVGIMWAEALSQLPGFDSSPGNLLHVFPSLSLPPCLKRSLSPKSWILQKQIIRILNSHQSFKEKIQWHEQFHN